MRPLQDQDSHMKAVLLIIFGGLFAFMAVSFIYYSTTGKGSFPLKSLSSLLGGNGDGSKASNFHYVDYDTSRNDYPDTFVLHDDAQHVTCWVVVTNSNTGASLSCLRDFDSTP